MQNPHQLIAPEIQQLNSGQSLIEAYDFFILDLWGVVHNGLKPYPGALDFMAAVAKAGKQTVLLSNAPRRISQVEHTLSEVMNIPKNLYALLMSSGEDAFESMRDKPDPFYQSLRNKAWLLGVLPNDISMTQGLDKTFVDDPRAADFVLNTGPSGPTHKAEDWDQELAFWLEHAVPMICANPDRVVHKGDQLHICAGTIAERFENMGGQVRWHGKPFAEVYQKVFVKLEGLGFKAKADKGLMIGDSFITDIAGAQNAGLDSVLITGGIYRDAISERGLAEVAQETGYVPTFAMPGLAA